MWFPELFQRIQSGESQCSRSAGSMNVNQSQANLTCEEKVVKNRQIYFESFLVALSNLPGNIIMIILVNRIGRRRLLGKFYTHLFPGMCRLGASGGVKPPNIFKFARKLIKRQPCCKRIVKSIFCDLFFLSNKVGQ